MGRVSRKLALAQAATRATPAALPACALCGRKLGTRVEWHHVVPKSEGGRDTVPVHPICHRTIHAAADNATLARLGDLDAVRALPAVARFLRWVAGKPSDFHAPTRRGRDRSPPNPTPWACRSLSRPTPQAACYHIDRCDGDWLAPGFGRLTPAATRTFSF